MTTEAISDVISARRTPIVRLAWEGADGPVLWVKRDDLTHPLYGGNKVRKLQHILVDARRRGARRIVTFGAAGSHHVLATTLFGTRMGLEVAAILTPQPFTTHAEEVLRAALGAGLLAWPAPTTLLAPLVLLANRRRGDLVVPPGGSNVLGAEGYVDAARELADDVAEGAMPAPDLVVVPVGSGGTAAGLAAGLGRAGLRARVHGVAVYTPTGVTGFLTKRLVRGLTTGDPRARAAALHDLTIDGSYAGPGYGVGTTSGARAAEIASQHGLSTDPTYTAKTLACAMQLATTHPGTTILYWHTLSSASMAPLLADAPAVLPRRLARLLTRA